MKKLGPEKYKSEFDMYFHESRAYILSTILYNTSSCFINRLCMEDPECREKRRARSADT